MLLFLITSSFASTTVRVANWNVETLGAPGSVEYEMALDVALRVGADVLCFNEIGSNADAAYLSSFAIDAGYNHYAVATASSFGSDRSACLSDYNLNAEVWTAARISGQAAANDITRTFLAVTVDLPTGTHDLVVISNHYKSGSANRDEFRRVIEAYRTGQLLQHYAGSPTLFMGDLNADVDDPHEYPALFNAIPTGLPLSWSLGADLSAVLRAGMDNDPFAYLDPYAVRLDTPQADGSLVTRPSSGRHLDYIYGSSDLVANAVGETYNSALEGTAGPLSWLGAALSSGSSLSAADHLPVVVEVLVP